MEPVRPRPVGRYGPDNRKISRPIAANSAEKRASRKGNFPSGLLFREAAAEENSRHEVRAEARSGVRGIPRPFASRALVNSAPFKRASRAKEIFMVARGGKLDYSSPHRADPARRELMNALSIQSLTGIISTANVSALLINKSISGGGEC